MCDSDSVNPGEMYENANLSQWLWDFYGMVYIQNCPRTSYVEHLFSCWNIFDEEFNYKTFSKTLLSSNGYWQN